MSRRKQSHPKPIKHDDAVYDSHFDSKTPTTTTTRDTAIPSDNGDDGSSSSYNLGQASDKGGTRGQQSQMQRDKGDELCESFQNSQVAATTRSDSAIPVRIISDSLNRNRSARHTRDARLDKEGEEGEGDNGDDYNDDENDVIDKSNNKTIVKTECYNELSDGSDTNRSPSLLKYSNGPEPCRTSTSTDNPSPTNDNLHNLAPNATSCAGAVFPSTRRRRYASHSDADDNSDGDGDGGGASSPSLDGPIHGRKILERDLASHLQLPSDVLYLQKEDIRIHGTTSVGWIVCSSIPLPQGSSLGPFQGQQVSPDAVKVGDLIIQLTNKRGQQALINVAGQSGGWLALLRTPTSSGSRNTHVYLEGGRIWCEIVADLEVGSELRATFSFQNEEVDDSTNSNSPDDCWKPRATQQTTSTTATAAASRVEQQSNQAVTPTVQAQPVRPLSPTPGHAALIYGCPFCGVRFSSPRTLQGHLSFYCSKKTSERIVSPGNKETGAGIVKTEHQEEESEGIRKPKDSPLTPVDNGLPSRRHLDNSSPLSEHESEIENQNQIHKCKYCSYTAEKQSSLNRHMRIHKSEDRLPPTALPFINEPKARPTSHIKSPSMESFCQDCRIQFSNIHTFRCHKEHYCAQRQKKRTIPAITDTPAYAIFPPGVIFPQASGIDIQTARAIVRGSRISIPDEDAIPGPSLPMMLPTPILTTDIMRGSGIALTNVKSPQDIERQTRIRLANSFRNLYAPRISETHSRISETHSQRYDEDSAKVEDANMKDSVENVAVKEEIGEREEEKEEEPKERFSKGADDHPLDLTTSKKPSSSAHLSGISREQVMMKQDYRELGTISPSTSSSSFDIGTSFVKGEPESRSPSSEQAVIQMNQKLAASIHSMKNGLSIPTNLTALPEAAGQIPIQTQLLPHPSVLVPPMPFLPVAALRRIPSPPEKPIISSQGISKCSDCNIVFYKHENYLVHRRYYCSGMRHAGNPQEEIQEEMPPSPIEDMPLVTIQRDGTPIRNKEEDASAENQSNKSFSPMVESRDDLSLNDVKYKYYCVPCRIKFSNASILAAHKEYYCPAGKDSEQSVVAQASSGHSLASSDSLSQQDPQEGPSKPPPPQEFNCSKCKSTFASARLLRLHLCDGGFPCPHCDHLAVTENRLSEHIKVHAPTRAFRCTICGYRGNTARGMRMHGKTHIDEGMDFTDENMLEYHEPAIMPIIPSVGVGQNSDSELLRIKNEPYKRRRSRKAYEKFDYPQVKIDIPQSCSLCGQSFPNSESLASHFKVHEIAATQYLAGLMKCLHCDYVGSSPEDLRAHFEVNHLRTKRKRMRAMSGEEDAAFENHHQSTTFFNANQDFDEHGERKVMRRESPQEEGMSCSSPREHRPTRNDARLDSSSESSQDVNSMIPTTVKEEEMLLDGEESVTSVRKEKLRSNFLDVPDVRVKTERLSPPEIVFPNQTSENIRAFPNNRTSPPRAESSSGKSPHSNPHRPRAVPRKSPVDAERETNRDNFLINVKEEPMTDFSSSENNHSKFRTDEGGDFEGHVNGSHGQSPERPPSVIMPPQRDDKHVTPRKGHRSNLEASADGPSKALVPPSSPNYFHRPMSCLFIPSNPYRPPVLPPDDTKSYCHDCDIFFSRPATYIAHKKHYCRGAVRAEKQPFVPA